ncbi:sperm acrosome membrane-associated protein 6 isoform X2 [Vulpes lagopus]|uniref:sperm acrosome membrane-associated protein 6 isoform X2 n=1 Tax=Vulpes lagopus TaxID=494514 RepID=UPI001BC8E689|nr:sperm acrosome membrane-associated protein 6 isoform X2 [Vulpes lagopus]
MALLAQGSTVPSALVALMVFRGPTWACLFCFTSYEDRVRICQIFAGVEGPELEKCQKAFITAFRGLLDIEINDYERNHLHDAFTQMTHTLQEMAMAQGSFKVAFPNAAKKMQEVIKKLKEGVQEASRSFRCRGCYSHVCELSLDCPVQDLTVTRGQQAKFSCSVNFSLPQEEITYSWKFAGGGVSRSGASAKDVGGGFWFSRKCGSGRRGARARFRLRARGRSGDWEAQARLGRRLGGAWSCVRGQRNRGVGRGQGSRRRGLARGGT